MDERRERKVMDLVIRTDQARIGDHLGERLRGTVEIALNALLDAERIDFAARAAMSAAKLAGTGARAAKGGRCRPRPAR
jgi:hypothetical protein